MNPFYQQMGFNKNFGNNNFNSFPYNNNFNNAQNMTISINDFREIEKLGEGNFGSVHKVQYKDGNIYALKKIKQEKFQGKDKAMQEKDFYREKKILYALTEKNCPNIVRLYGDFEDQNYRYLIMEYAEGQSLADIIKDCSDKNIKL